MENNKKKDFLSSHSLKSYPVAIGPGYAEVEVGVPDEAAPADAAALQSAHLVAGVVAVDVAVHATLRPQRAVASADAVLVLMTRGRERPPVTESMLGAFYKRERKKG